MEKAGEHPRQAGQFSRRPAPDLRAPARPCLELNRVLSTPVLMSPGAQPNSSPRTATAQAGPGRKWFPGQQGGKWACPGLALTSRIHPLALLDPQGSGGLGQRLGRLLQAHGSSKRKRRAGPSRWQLAEMRECSCGGLFGPGVGKAARKRPPDSQGPGMGAARGAR